MTFSREPYQTAISRNEPIAKREIAYYRQRAQHEVFAKLIAKFADKAERYGLTKAKLARLTDKDPAQVNRALSLPSNMTIETLSDFALAMGCEPEIYFSEFADAPRHNFTHSWMTKYMQPALVKLPPKLESGSSTTRPAITLTKTTILELADG